MTAARVTVHYSAPQRPLPAGGLAVVMDVLRATTTLTVALAAGAARVTPVASPEAAFELGRRRPNALLCGERGGLKVPGFALGNSPFEYTAERVAGRELVFASTNGSLALIAAHRSRRRLIAAFVNASAVLRELVRAGAMLRSVGGDAGVTLVCAGKEGRFSLEDSGLAGWLCAGLAAHGWTLEASARSAVRLAPVTPDAVRALVEGSDHGREMRALGPAWAADVTFCATLDRLDRAFEI